MKNKMNVEIRVSQIMINLYLIIGFAMLIIAILFIPGVVKESAVAFFVLLGMGLSCIFRALYARSERIYITNMDIKYASWFHRKAIKTVESFNTNGIWIFNSVVFTGRGGARIKMSYVENLDKVRKLVESVDHIKYED